MPAPQALAFKAASAISSANLVPSRFQQILLTN